MTKVTIRKPNVRGFLRQCVPGLGRVYAKALAERPDFGVFEWMRIYQYCSEPVPMKSGRQTGRCPVMQTIAADRAVAMAKTVEEWKCIYDRTWHGRHHTLAGQKVRELEPAKK